MKRNRVVNLIKKKKTQHYRKVIHDSSNDAKKLYNTLNILLGKNSENILPDDMETDDLKEDFAETFQDKIDGFQTCFNQDVDA